MIRLNNSFGSYELVQKIVSKVVSHYIRLYLGEPDGDGNLTDEKRMRAFMRRTPLLAPLYGKNCTKGAGLISSETTWEKMILERYSDILAKVEDSSHEYTFDEFGEGLVFSLCDVRNLAMCDDDDDEALIGDIDYESAHYFWEYEENGEDLFNELIKAVKKEMPEYFDTLEEEEQQAISEICSKYEIDVSILHNYFAHMYAETVCDIGSYNGEDFDDMAKEMSINDVIDNIKIKNNKRSIDESGIRNVLEGIFFLYESPILWDYDYLTVFDMLASITKNDADNTIKTLNSVLGFTMTSYDTVFKPNDMCLPINCNTETN